MPVDTRFFEFLGTSTVGDIAALIGAEVKGDPARIVSNLSPVSNAEAGDLCYYEGRAKTALTDISDRADVVIVKADTAALIADNVTALIVPAPRFAYIAAAQSLFRQKEWSDEGPAPSIHPTAKVAPTAFISAGAAIGAQSSIGPGAFIGPGVQIGTHTRIGANASVRCALIGNHVTIFSGVRIGESGFGVTVGPDGAVDVPQWGRVIVQDHVLIGANSCIDRGALSDTVLGERTKIDNLVQIGHNVTVGRNVMMASFAGMSGSVKVGDNVIMGGRVTAADHVNIGANSKVAGASGILRDIPEGETWGGTPAKPLRQYLREVAWIQKQTAPKKKPTS